MVDVVDGVELRSGWIIGVSPLGESLFFLQRKKSNQKNAAPDEPPCCAGSSAVLADAGACATRFAQTVLGLYPASTALLDCS